MSGEERRKHRRILLWILGILLVSIPVIAYGIFWMFGAAAADKADQLAKESGLPATLADLRMPPLPNEENAAVEVWELTRLLNSSAFDPNTYWDYLGVLEPATRNFPSLWSADTATKVELLAKFNEAPLSEAMATIDKLVSKPGYSPDLKWEDGYNLMLPHLSATRSTVRLLCLRGWLRADAGDTAGATADFRKALQVGWALHEEPIFISQLVVIACDVATLHSIQATIRHVSPEAFTTDQLQLLIDEIAEHQLHAGHPRLVTALRGEFACFEDIVNQAKAGNIDATALGIDSEFGIVNKAGILLSPLLDMESLHVTRIYANAMQLDDTPPYSPDFHNPFDVASPKYFILSRMLIPVLTRAPAKFAGHKAELTVTKLSLQLILLAREQGSYPEQVDDLPLDPLNGEPLNYERTNDGFKLWSVGLDGIDKGGEIDTSQGAHMRNDDILFQIGERWQPEPEPEPESEPEPDAYDEFLRAE